MFDYGPPTAAEYAADTLRLAAIAAAARAENRDAYNKVDSAAEFHHRWTTRRPGLIPRTATAWSHAAWVEIATTLAVSTTTAAQLVEVGTALRERLPKTRAAFAAGEIDYVKARRIATATAGFGPNATHAAETAALGFAHRHAPGGFATAIEDALMRIAPEEYAALRRDAEQRARKVRRRTLGVVDRIEADLSPPEAAAVWQRLGEVAATVCGNDPRDAQHRLVDAYLAVMHGEDHLACTCGRSDCTADPTAPTRRTPLVQITVDAATLLGLRADPAYLPGHGPIDADLARELATDATWQPILTELTDLARTAGVLTPEQAATLQTPTPDHTETSTSTGADTTPRTAAHVSDETTHSDPAGDTEPRPAGRGSGKSRGHDAGGPTDAHPPLDTAAQSTADSMVNDDSTTPPSTGPAPATGRAPAPEPSPVESELRARLCHPRLATFVARGSRRRSGQLPSCPRAPKPILVPVRSADLYEQFVELLATCPQFADGIHPDGHGGLRTPPPRATGYRPSAEVAALVRARDRTCRFPHCTVPAAHCQLDHIVAFDHHDPAAGGWTIPSNLHSVCRLHHELKTVGLWHARALPGMAILWTGPRADRHLTLPAGGLTPVPPADLRATVPAFAGRGAAGDDGSRTRPGDDPPVSQDCDESEE